MDRADRCGGGWRGEGGFLSACFSRFYEPRIRRPFYQPLASQSTVVVSPSTCVSPFHQPLTRLSTVLCHNQAFSHLSINLPPDDQLSSTTINQSLTFLSTSHQTINCPMSRSTCLSPFNQPLTRRSTVICHDQLVSHFPTILSPDDQPSYVTINQSLTFLLSYQP